MPARSRTNGSPRLVWTVYDVYELKQAKNRAWKASRGHKRGPVRSLRASSRTRLGGRIG